MSITSFNSPPRAITPVVASNIFSLIDCAKFRIPPKDNDIEVTAFSVNLKVSLISVT